MRWRLSPDGPMRVPGIVFASKALLPDVEDALQQAATGPTPKGTAMSGLRLADDDGQWHARALVDV